jgi:hypothetical protein
VMPSFISVRIRSMALRRACTSSRVVLALSMGGIFVAVPLGRLVAQGAVGQTSPTFHRAGAQSPTPQAGSPYALPADGGQGSPSDTPPNAGGLQGAQRQQLEQRLRQRFEQIVRQRLHLTDQQVVQLRQTNQHFALRRRELNERERGVRQAMRAELRNVDALDQPRLAAQIDSIFALQRLRLDIAVSEQRELSGFLTPSQRVQYYALQEQLRQRVEQLRRQRQMTMQQRGGDGSTAMTGLQPSADTLRP